MDDAIEANYVDLVAGGAHTWVSLRATAVAHGWDEVVALCDRHTPTTKPRR